MLGAYRPLLALRDGRRLFLASLVGRLAIGMLSLPLVLLVRGATGSFAAAGVAAGAGSVGVAVSSPLRGRLLDRLGPRRALAPLVAVETVVLAGLPVVAETGSAAALTAVSAVTGVTALPLVAAMRTQWKRLLGEGNPRIEQAYALETVAQISVFVAGPALAGLLVALTTPAATLEVCAALTLAGGAAFALRAPPGGGRAPDVRPRRPLAVPGVRTLVGITFLADVALGVVDVAVVAAAQRAGHPGAGGVLLALFSGSSAIGGAYYGARTYRRSAAWRLAVITGAGAVLFLPLALADSLPLLAVALVIAGPPTAAQWATASVALDRVAPAGAANEAFTWLSSANAAGVALGSAIAGVVTDHAGTSTAFLAASAAAAAACLLVLARSRTLA